jgi:hypothetical protein
MMAWPTVATGVVTVHTHGAAPQIPLAINEPAFGGFALCLVLLAWWGWRQTTSRCETCGFCPVWCRCPH